jgi:CYTH domain-containing protein
MPKNQEIERKFLLRGLPPGLENDNAILIVQEYLLTGDPEIRIRAKGKKFMLTQKTGSGLTRTETEIEIPYEVYEILENLSSSSRLVKYRYKIQGDDGLTWEIDEYQGALLEGLVIAEVELPSEDTSPQMPQCISDVFVKQVTDDPAYKNQSLATNGLPL